MLVAGGVWYTPTASKDLRSGAGTTRSQLGQQKELDVVGVRAAALDNLIRNQMTKTHTTSQVTGPLPAMPLVCAFGSRSET